MSHSVIENYLHIIFSTKDRLPLIPSEMEGRLYAYLRAIASKRCSTIVRINGVSDHIHMLVNLHPDAPLSVLVKELKSYSTGWLKREGYSSFSWQVGYGAFSCSKILLDRLIGYIDRQKEHHKKTTFAEELQWLNAHLASKWIIEKSCD